MKNRHTIALSVALFAFCLLPFALKSQQVEFGKNRLQFRKKADQWVYFETANFVTYWFGDARAVAQTALQTAEFDFADLESMLEHPLSEKIELIVYHDLTDLKTSNLGAGDDSDGARDGLGRSLYQLAYTGGQLAGSDTKTRVIGGKIFVYFDGNHLHLRNQIREGMAGVMLNSMLFGSNLQEIVQNAVLLNLPPWFTDGLLGYCAEDWSPELDNQLRDVIASGKYKTFEKLSRAYPRLAGHAMWHYVNLHFGRQTVSNLLYLTRINRSVESGFLYVLGGTYKRNCEAMMLFFKKRYSEDAKNLTAPDAADEFKAKGKGQKAKNFNKKNLPITQLRLSPDGKRMAFVTSDLGKWRVKIWDFEKEKMSILMKGSFRNAIQTTDFNYPLLAWSANGRQISVVFEQRDVLKLRRFDFVSGEKTSDKLPPDFMRIYSMSAIGGENLLFSALVKGQTDLFIYKTKTRGTERLTNDFWDDLDATVFQQGEKRGILWASNRLSDTLETDKLDSILPLARFDIFYLPLNEAAVAPPALNSKPETQNPKLEIPRTSFYNVGETFNLADVRRSIVRVTNTPSADERRPVQVDSIFFSFLGDESGVMNLNSGQLEDFPAFHRQVFFKKNGEEIILEGQFSSDKNDWATLERAWKKAPDAESGEILFSKLKIDTTLKLPKKAELDSVRLTEIWKKRAITWNQTSFDRQVSDISVAQNSGKLAELIWRNGRYHIFLKKAEPRKNRGARLSFWRLNQQALLGILPTASDSAAQNLTQMAILEIPRDSVKTELLAKNKINPDWLFQTPFEIPAPEATKVQVAENEPVSTGEPAAPRIEGSVRGRDFAPQNGQKIVRFNPSRIVPYRLKFRTESMKLTVDNSLLFEGLDSYAGTPTDNYRTPPVGILAKGVFNDLFEDYTLSGGVRIPTTFNGAEYFMLFDNKKRRLDRRVALYRKTTQFRDDSDGGHHGGGSAEIHRARLNTVLGQYELRWPLDLFTSLRATATMRQDRSFDLTTDEFSLANQPLTEQRAAFRLSAVFDNTIDIDLNLRTGSRAKIWVEAVKGININPEQRQFDLKNGYMTVIGLDARHYQRLDRRSIFATRLAAGTSFGSERILYFLGGTDQAFFPKFNERIPLPTGDDFAFQTAATNLRGFKLNIRNGNSFVLLNNELRVPVFKYFSSKPTMAAFWRNFQLTGFFDVGTAWQGKNPYNATNPINTTYLENPPTVFVKVNYFRDPLVAGYGFGARTTLFGFFLRADYGWGIETRKVQDPMWHLAMGVDF